MVSRQQQLLVPTKGGAFTYADKVLGMGPIRYWPLWDTAGAAAEELVVGDDGTYVGATLGAATAPDGSPCPLFDGINDYVHIWSALFAAAFNGQEGSLFLWTQVFNLGVWVDGVQRNEMGIVTGPGANDINMFKSVAVNTHSFQYFAGGVGLGQNTGGIADVVWAHAGLTWSLSAPPTGEVRYYRYGLPDGPMDVGLGAWVGAPINGWTLIGARSVAPLSPYHGWLSHAAIWDRPLTPAEIAELATV